MTTETLVQKIARVLPALDTGGLTDAAEIIRHLESATRVDGYTIHNASSVFSGKNIAYAFDLETAKIIAAHGDAHSKYKSDIRESWIHHQGTPHKTWRWKTTIITTNPNRGNGNG